MKSHPSVQARCQMHSNSKTLQIYLPEERPPLLKGHFFIAEDILHTTPSH